MLPGTYAARSLDTGATAEVELRGSRTGRLRRELIVAFIAAHWAEHGWAPTIREVAAAAGLTRPDAAKYHLLLLRTAGRVAFEPDTARSLRVVAE